LLAWGLLLGTLAYFYLRPPVAGGYLPCLFHQWTGWQCPGCGSQRALHALLHGHVVDAVSQNALFVGVLVLAILGWIAGKERRAAIARMGRQHTGLVFAAVLLVMLAFGILRNLPFAR
jgi:hypothetical protein